MLDPHAQFQRPSLDESEPILSQIGRLAEGSPVRRAALQVIRGERLASSRPLTETLLNPSVRRWRERAVAAWTLGHAVRDTDEADSAASTLMDVLEGAHRERFTVRAARAILRHIPISLGAGLAAAVVTSFWLNVVYSDRSNWYPPLLILAIIFISIAATMGLPLVAAASFLYDRKCDDSVRAAAAEALGHLGVADSVGTLAGRLFDRDARVRRASASALHSLLPLLTPDHFGLFGAESMAHLGRGLSHPDTQLVSKVLTALHSVGTSHALPWVKRFAIEGRTTRLRDSAKDLMDVLEARRAKELNGERLLRPAVAGDAQAVLLRPAREGDAESELLMRTVE